MLKIQRLSAVQALTPSPSSARIRHLRATLATALRLSMRKLKRKGGGAKRA